MLEGSKQNAHVDMIFMDEPDMALSIRSCHKLVALLKKLGKKQQIVAAVHNPIVIGGFPEVYSTEHCRWMPLEEFIGSHSAKPSRVRAS